MKIGFAKLFKVSGTTVADILLRLSYFYGSFFDLQQELETFNNVCPLLAGQISKFDILIEDKQWNSTEVEKMIGQESIHITMIRDPVDQFESMFHYMDMRKFYNVSSFERFLQKLELNSITENRSFGLFGRNQLCFSLGLKEELFENDTAIESFLQKTDRKFQLVMISSLFDESIILLKNMLGSHISQMLYVNQLSRKKETKYKLFEKQRVLLEKWLRADITLYNMFKRKLEERLTKKIRAEVKVFKKWNIRLQKFCKVSKHVVLGAQSPSERFGQLELELIRSSQSNLLCDFYVGDSDDRFIFLRKAIKDARELQRVFSNL